MGRPPVGKVAMSDSERHRRYMARLRQRAAAGGTVAPAPQRAQACSFCGKTAAQVSTLVVANGAGICDRCAERAIWTIRAQR